MILLLLACTAEPETKDPTGPPDTVPDTDPTGSTDSAPTDSGPTDTDPTETTGPCAVDAGLSVLEVTPSTPWTAHELAVEVTLSAPADVAVRCVLDGDPDEVHLVESTAAASTHDLRLSGLLADATYTCAAAAVCPQAGSGAVAFSHTTGSDPSTLPRVGVTVDEPGAGDEYVLMNAADDCTWDVQHAVVFDRAGRTRWVYPLPAWVGPSIEFVYHGNDQFAWGGGWSPNSTARPRLVDLYEGEVYDTADAIPDYATTLFHHDGKRVADGRWATLEEVQLRAPSGGWFKGFQTRLVDPDTNEVVTTYNAQRAIDEGHLPGGTDDAWHANWVDVVTQGDHQELLVNTCYLYLTMAVDAEDGTWLWSFGQDGDFALVDPDGHALPDSEFPQCQHGLQRVGDKLLVYDNGFDRGYSRAVEYTLDLDTMVATENWSWTEDDWYETTLGSVDYLPSGHVLIGMGHAECFSSNPRDHTTTVEIDPTSGEKLWELRYAATDQMAYRADWADPCTLFTNGKYCPAVASRAEALAGAFGD